MQLHRPVLVPLLVRTRFPLRGARRATPARSCAPAPGPS